MKSPLWYAVVFAGLVIAAWGLSLWDPIGPAVAEARLETHARRAGVTSMQIIDSGMTLLFKWLLAGSVAGLAGAAWMEGRKMYRQWFRDRTAGRMRSAAIRPPAGPSIPRAARGQLSQDELAAIGRLYMMQGGQPRLPLRNVRSKGRLEGDGDDPFADLDF